MPDGGRIRLRTWRTSFDAAFVAMHGGSHVGDYVALSVADTGIGIPADHLPMVFEPFFSTKRSGEGTGLGLAAVYGIVKQSGGYVTVESAVGRGATFVMYFPVSGSANQPAPPVEVPAAAPEEGGETVLTIEDDESLRIVLRRVLQGHGYKVLEAVDGQEAVEKFLHLASTLDLLLTDVVLPGRNGVELARMFREKKPDLPVMFMTGYADPELFKGMVINESTALIRKPYLPSVLVRQLRDLLQRTAPRT